MQTKNQIENQIQDFFNIISKEDLTSIETKLRTQYPGADDYYIAYWTTRIAFFTNGETNFNFESIGPYVPINSEIGPYVPIDPETIRVSFDPDYGSC